MLFEDFDGNRRNDFTLRNGTDVSGSEYRHSLVGNDWKVDDTDNPGLATYTVTYIICEYIYTKLLIQIL